VGSVIGVVADDITGANDIGIMFAKVNIVTHVYTYDEFPAAVSAAGRPQPGVVILDTNSRLDDPSVAYDKVFQATSRLLAAGATLLINKTCSVFRGNIGPEFDAMLDCVKREFAVVVLGFPKNGRTTVNGIHYVHGRRLEESEFRSDPVHPMTRSSLEEILRLQTKRRVGLVTHETVDRGAEVLRDCLRDMKDEVNYAIVDVTDQEALRTIARAVRDEFVLCGSSALAEELAHVLSLPREGEAHLDIPQREGIGILCTAGSLMPQTASQISYLREKGVPVFELDSRKLVASADAMAEELDRLASVIAGCLESGSHAVLHSSNDPEIVQETKRLGQAIGMSTTEVSRLVSESLAEITARVLGETGQNRLVVAGGETSAAVCATMNVRGLRVWKEIQAGLPSCVSLSDPALLLVLKSGSFGSVRFLEEAILHLIQEA
jgi:uncharacterized protein YgbK (DUF1537 family)